jgi:hypothetical protein
MVGQEAGPPEGEHVDGQTGGDELQDGMYPKHDKLLEV